MSDFSALIPDDKSLRLLLPPSMASVMGEASLLEKLTPFLDQRADWLTRYFGEPALLAKSDFIAKRAKELLALRAFIDAIPSLDLILSSNGFGVVNTNAIAPASKERVAALIESSKRRAVRLEEELIRAIWAEHAIFNINKEPDDRLIIPGIWCETVFPTPDSLVVFMSVDRFVELLPAIEDAQHILEREVIGEALLADLIRNNWRLNITRVPNRLLSLVQSWTRSLVINDNRDSELEAAIIDHIRNREDLMRMWIDSDAAALWNVKPFRNKRNSSGYVF